MFTKQDRVKRTLDNIVCSHFEMWAAQISEVITLPKDPVERATEVKKFINRCVTNEIEYLKQEEK